MSSGWRKIDTKSITYAQRGIGNIMLPGVFDSLETPVDDYCPIYCAVRGKVPSLVDPESPCEVDDCAGDNSPTKVDRSEEHFLGTGHMTLLGKRNGAQVISTEVSGI